MDTVCVSPKGLTKHLVTCVKKRLPVMVWGPPGVGKSSIVAQVASGFGIPLIDFRANLREPVDLLGVPSINNGITTWNPPEFLPDEDRDGKNGIFLIDELPNAHRATQTALYQLILDFKLGNYEFPDGWVIIAAGNRMEDQAGTYAMPAPLKSRMLHFELEPNLDEWTEWANLNNVAPCIIAFLRTEKDSFYPTPLPDQTATANPRTWNMLSQLIYDGKNDVESVDLVQIQAAVGLDQAHKFDNFLEILSKLPPITELFSKPASYPAPEKSLATLYAIISLLAIHTTVERLKATIQYARRLPVEFQTMLAQDLMQRSKTGTKEDRQFIQSADYNTWVVDLQTDLQSHGE